MEKKSDDLNNNNEIKKPSLSGIIRMVILAVLAIVIVYEAVMIFRDQKEYSVAVNEYEDIRDIYVGTVEDKPKTDDVKEADHEVSTEEDYPDLDIDFAALKEINSDFIGWIYFPALPKVNYPVVKERFIDQYLYKTFEGASNKAGCIFMDVLSDSDFSGMSDMVFGHNMKNQSMFGSLKLLYKTKDEDLLADNPYVYIYTEKKVLKYRAFAYYTTSQGSFSYNEVKSESDYDKYLDYIKKNSLIEVPSDISFDEYPSLLTLSTCSGQTGSGRRFVIHTVRCGTFER